MLKQAAHQLNMTELLHSVKGFGLQAREVRPLMCGVKGEPQNTKRSTEVLGKFSSKACQ
jgi:hypothetical protein